MRHFQSQHMIRLSEKCDVLDQLVNHLIGVGWHNLPSIARILLTADRKAGLQALFKSTLHQLMTGQIRLVGETEWTVT